MAVRPCRIQPDAVSSASMSMRAFASGVIRFPGRWGLTVAAWGNGDKEKSKAQGPSAVAALWRDKKAEVGKGSGLFFDIWESVSETSEGCVAKGGDPVGCSLPGAWQRCSSVAERLRLCSFVAPCQSPARKQLSRQLFLRAIPVAGRV